MKKLVHVQSVLPTEDVIALKEKTKETSIKEAISKAVYHYLNCKKKYAKKKYNMRRKNIICEEKI